MQLFIGIAFSFAFSLSFALNLSTKPVKALSLGCFTQTNTAFPATLTVANATLKNEFCFSTCAKAGHKFFAVTGIDCLCGDTPPDQSGLSSQTNCAYPCPGNQYEHCAIDGYLNVFSIKGDLSLVVSSTKLSSTKALTSSISKTSPSSKASSTSKASASSKASSKLSSSSKVSSNAPSSSTVSSKTSHVTAGSIPGIKRNAALQPRAAPAKVPSLGCWKFTPGSSSIMKIQPSVTIDPTNFKVGDCQSACSGYSFFGVTAGADGNLCFCATAPTFLGATSVSLPSCYQPCTGNQFEMCGDVGYLFIFGTPPCAAPTTAPVLFSTIYQNVFVTMNQTATATATVTVSKNATVSISTAYATITATVSSNQTCSDSTSSTSLPTASAFTMVNGRACPITNCNNSGLAFGAWNPLNNPSFDPVIYKNDTTNFIGNGTSLTIGPFSVNPGASSIYGLSVPNGGLVLIDHRGYFFAPLNGTYTFTLPRTDEYGYLWTGPLAYSGWNRTNANMVNYWNDAVTTSFSISLTAGRVIPLRMLWMNLGGPGSLSFSITDPTGVQLIPGNFPNCPFLLQNTCDGNNPRYPAWNSET